MHTFFRDIAANDLRRSAAHELTVVRDDHVAKIVQCAPDAELRNVDIDGVNGWQHFHWLTAAEAAQLSVPSGRWLLALRTFTPGESLDVCRANVRAAEGVDDDVYEIALKLALRVRDLHELDTPHGDLQPGNVVVAGPDVWLIDLAPVKTRPGDVGHVAGSAPLMAPELWAGEAPTLQSDVYALGCLVHWLVCGQYAHEADDLAKWAAAHRGGDFVLGEIPAALSGVVRRALHIEPAERPAIQEFIDALATTAEVETMLPPMVAGGLRPLDLEALAQSLMRPASHVHIVGPPRSGRTFTARELTTRVVSSGRVVVSMVGVDPLGGFVEVSTSDDPWQAVRALLRSLAWTIGAPADFPELGRGDRLWAFEQITDRAIELVAGRPVTIVWDDFDQTRPDTRAWWSHFVDAIARRGLDVSTLTLSGPAQQLPAVRVEIPALDAVSWNQWRATTLRTEVRDTSQARWDQLVADFGEWIGVMFAQLDQELGARRVLRVRKRRDIDTGTLLSMRAGWAERVEQLAEQCAFDEVIATVATLYDSLKSRGATDRETTGALLAAWTSAVIAGGGGRTEDELRTALIEQCEIADEPATFALLQARLANALGTHADGLAALEGVQTEEPALRAEIASWRGQLALSLGRMDDVHRYVADGLEHLPEGADGAVAERVRLHLQLLSHAPDALMGKVAAIEALAELAPRLDTVDVDAMLRARLHAYRAIGLTSVGSLDEATDAHLRALEEIEAGGLSAELPTYLLNAGTAYHRQGRLGLAREYYARGLRVAQATTRASTRALLHANQANVDLALGRLSEAQNLVRRGLELARAHGLSNIEVMCRSVEGDIQLASGDAAGARSTYLAILDDRDELGARQHQIAEVQLAIAEAALLARDPTEAGRRLDDARRMIEESKFADLEHYHGILRARLQWLEGGALGTMAGIELFRRNLLQAEESGNHRLVLRQAPRLMHQLADEGLDELFEEVSTVVQSSRNAIAMGLGRELRRDFFANLPSVDGLRKRPTAPDPAAATAIAATPARGDVEPFYRMLSLNEVILHADSLDAMLPDALEIAMSLSHAERGFILLRDDAAGRIGTFRVAASRDVDGQPIPSPHLAVSLTIAEEAARTGRTVVTLNAREDGRFSEALSVVDLDLTSVLCVPVRDGSGLLGALYMDHRFRPGIFESEVPRMMEAFGHQLALAVTNARRLDELRATKSELAELLEERESMLVGLERRVSELTEEVERKHADATLRGAFPEIAFGSRAMERVLSQVERVARGDIPVVVTGESGVGKELIARAVHDASPRKKGPFIAFNCGAVSDTLFESEMFGHVKGAFTGADIDRQGLFQAAGGGTIFLDEIGEMPLSMQVKLLRVLQERQVRRVGEARSTPVDVRVVAATNRDLLEMVQKGEFREDLYYRLAAFVIEIPPLRDRREDIPLIAAKLLDHVAVETGRDLKLTPAGARMLAQCEWYGNVRELENTLRTAAVMTESAQLDEPELAPLVRLRTDTTDPRRVASTRALETRGRRRKANRLDVVEALRRAGDDRDKAAEILGVSERTLYRYLKRWDLYD